MHCLPPTFSCLSCSDTEEVCLAASETVPSSNQPATTMAAIISSSAIFFFFFPSLFDVSSRPFFCPEGPKSKWYQIDSHGLLLGLKLRRYIWSGSNPRKEGGKNSNGKLMDICWFILFIYFCSGRGQPDEADNKQMWLEGRCRPGRATDPSVRLSLGRSVCLSVCKASSCASLLASMLGVSAVVVWCWMGEWVGRLGGEYHAVLWQSRPMLLLAACDCSAHIHGVPHCIAGWISRMNSTIVSRGKYFYQSTRLLFLPGLYNSLLKSLLPF